MAGTHPSTKTKSHAEDGNDEYDEDEDEDDDGDQAPAPDLINCLLQKIQLLRIAINAPLVGKKEISAAVSVLGSGALTSSATDGGLRVREFESAVASFTGSKHAVAVNSGTAALQAALHALGVGPKDEVLIPSFTFVATANAVVSTGATPVFVDIAKGEYTVDLEDLEKKITKKTRAIIPVHLYGHVADVDGLSKISAQHGIPVVEDAAQALGSTYNGRHAGTFFDMGCYSMYPAKVMTAGEGGVVVTNNKRLRDRLRMIRNHGMVRGYDTRMLGLNLRLPEISAAIATVQMGRLPGFLKSRRRNAKLLSDMISDLKVTLPYMKKDQDVNWCLYTIAARRRNRLLKRLNDAGIGAASYYPTPIHKTPLYRSGLRLPNTERAASQVLSLPVHPQVTTKDIRFIADTLRGAL